MTSTPRHRAAEFLAAEIVKDWSGPQSGFVVVVPPLNHSTVLFDRLRRPTAWLADDAWPINNFAIAYCPPSAYVDESELVAHALREWNISLERREYEDDRDLFGRAVRELCESDPPRHPILLLSRFARKGIRLSAEFLDSLQLLYRQHRLRIVVELPLTWHTIAERERHRGNSKLINSEFTQGFPDLLLVGLTAKEIAVELGETDEKSSITETVCELTGGFPDLVSLSASAIRRQVRRNELEPLLAEGCRRFFEYLDPLSGAGLRDALARLFLQIPDQSDRSVFERHEWREMLFDSDWKVRCRVLGYEAARTFSLHRRQQDTASEVERHVVKLVKVGSYAAARRLVEQCDPGAGGGGLRGLSHIAAVLEIARSGLDEWRHVLSHLSALDVLCRESGHTMPPVLAEWREFAENIEACTKNRTGPHPDLVELLCAREARPEGPRIALRLIASRLVWAEQIVEPLFATTAMVTTPEALVQLYCAAKLDLNFWAPPPLNQEHLEVIRLLPLKQEFQWPAQDRPMLFGQLLALSWPRQLSLASPERLVANYLELEKLQHLYTQQRVPLVHSLTMLNRKQWTTFPRRCRDLLINVGRTLMPDVPIDSLVLPPLETLYELFGEGPLGSRSLSVKASSPPEINSDSGRFSDSIDNVQPDFEQLRVAFSLHHLLSHRQLNGGLSGARVDIVEFHAGTDDLADLDIGVLKSTRRAEDFERERDGMQIASRSWLKSAMLPAPLYHSSGGIHYSLASLAFPAHTRRDVPSLHELVSGRRTIAVRATAKALGDLYARGLGTAHFETGTPREHLIRIWEPWAKRASAVDWARFGFPKLNDAYYLDQFGVRPNPLALLEKDDLWPEYRRQSISFKWCVQHGDLNAQNVLVGESMGGSPSCDVRLIDFEKTRTTSAFVDVCWVSLWCLMASASGSGAKIDPQYWERLPEAFVKESFKSVRPLPTRRDNDLDPFEAGLQFVGDLFGTLFGEDRKPNHLVPTQDMLALTMAGAALAKSFYTLRDLDKCKQLNRPSPPFGREWAVAFFRIATRALADFDFVIVDPIATPSVNLCHALTSDFALG